MKKTEVSIKTTILPNAPTKFKREVGTLLNTLIKDYKIKGKTPEHLEAFKKLFESNLYYILDNYFVVRPIDEVLDKTDKEYGQLIQDSKRAREHARRAFGL